MSPGFLTSRYTARSKAMLSWWSASYLQQFLPPGSRQDTKEIFKRIIAFLVASDVHGVEFQREVPGCVESGGWR